MAYVKMSMRSLKVPLTLQHLNPKKYCVNSSKLEKEARDHVRGLNKYRRMIERNAGRKQKEANQEF